jgi:predicted transcriptional regulator
MIAKYPELAKFSSYESILQELEKKGILRYIVEYRKLRDEVHRMITRMRDEGFDVDDEMKKLDYIKRMAPSLAPKVKDPQGFTRELVGYIQTLESMKSILEKRYNEAEEVKKYLMRLEELYEKGEVKEEAYLKLRAEYEDKMRKIKERTGTEVIGKETDVMEGKGETEIKR